MLLQMGFVRTRFAALWEVFSSPKLRRLELSLAGFYTADWAHFVAISVYAYARGGATAVGVFGLVRMTASASAAPLGGVLADRLPRQRILLAIHLGRAAALAAAAAVLAEHGPTAAVFALAGLASFCGGPFRPAHLALLPALARSAQELVAANVASSTFEGSAVLIGPAVAGGLLATTGPATIVGLSAGVSLWAALLITRLGVDEAWTPRRRPPGWTPLDETLAGLRTLRSEPRPRLVIGLFASQSFVRGLMNVLLVAASIELLHAGNSGVGFLNAALGAGGLVGGLATIRLVGRRRLATPFAWGLVLWGSPLAALAGWRELGWALFCVGVVGAGNAILDVSGYTLIQRTVDDAVLSRVFGVFEILVSGAAGVGSIVAPLLIDGLGVRWALVASGAVLPLLAVVCRTRLRAIDDSASVPERELALLRSIPIFAPLPVTAIERLAGLLVPVRGEPGEELVAQGAVGDRFYVVVSGEVDVTRDGMHVARLGPGDYFGEIALMHDVPRTASCSAGRDAELLTLDRDVFVSAMTGNVRSEREIEDVMSGRLAQLEQLATPP
jgi:MFS family permease